MKHIELTRGFKAIVDDEDFEKLNKLSWHYQPKSKTGYAVRSKGRSTERMHRLILRAKKGQQVDHINGNGLDNRKENLRIVSPKINAINRRSIPKSGYKGVSITYSNKKKQNKYYMARIGPRENHITIGLFKTAIEAAKAYDKKAIEIYGKLAVTNFKKENYL